jgi:hypothetical protein
VSFTDEHFVNLGLNVIPIAGSIDALSDIPTIRRPRPIFGSLDKPMLYRIIMDIIDMALQIFLIVNLMLPKPALPYTALALTIARRTLPRFGAAGTKISPGETGFNA